MNLKIFFAFLHMTKITSFCSIQLIMQEKLDVPFNFSQKRDQK